MSEVESASGGSGRILQTADERKATLDRSLQLHGAQGWRIETRSDFQATIAKGKEVSHLLHLFLTLITLGIWLIFWLGLGVLGGVKRRMITVDEYGNVVEQKL
ncbi:MAG: hypothetical protein U0R69_10130 [Gaiellales bacterium]